MKAALWAILPALIIAAPASAAPKDEAKPVATADVETAAAAEPVKACKKKKKSGLGGVLRAARSSGLISVVSGRAGTGGALVNSATSTAIDVADAANRMAPPPEKPKC